MAEAIVCEKMGWTHEEYERQPSWLVEILFVKWNCEAVYNNELVKKDKI